MKGRDNAVLTLHVYVPLVPANKAGGTETIFHDATARHGLCL